MKTKEAIESAKRILLVFSCFLGVMALGVSGWFILFVNAPLTAVPGAAAPSRDFEFGLFSQVANRENANTVFSPFAVRIDALMVRQGSKEETRAEINRTLYPLVQDASPAILENWEKKLKGLRGDIGSFRTVSRLWMQRDSEFEKNAMTEFQAAFGEAPGLVDFNGATEAARVEINTWFLQKAGPVGALLSPVSIDGFTRFISTSVAVAEPQWDLPFDRTKTEKGDFRIASGDRVSIPMMRLEARLPFVETGEFRVVELPCDGGQTAVTLIMPREDLSRARFISRLDARKIQTLLTSMREHDVEVFLPRARFFRTYALQMPLMSLGMNDAFDSSRADLAGFVRSHGPGLGGFYLNMAIHRAGIAFEDRLTDGSAGDPHELRLLEPGSRHVIFRASRPFIFLIRHPKTNTILLLGHLADPRD